MVIDPDQVDALVSHSRAESPNEACGLLALDENRVVAFYPIENAEASPVHYRMDSKDQLKAMLEIDDRGWDVAVVHSHTHTRAYPSQTDISLAFYPESLYVILSLADREPDIRAFRIRDGQVEEEAVELSHVQSR
jgi:[CysO sulfur-carrier protein]-S-L-cysteine hydrolase